MTAFTREIRVLPGYDHRDEPGDNRGAHGAEIVLILRGPRGAIAAKISTGWVSRPLAGNYAHGRGEQARRGKPGVDSTLATIYPSGSYVGAHSYEPREGFEKDGPCDWLGSAVCYGTGGFMASDKVVEILVAEGSDAAFEHLESLYRSWIESSAVVEAVAE